MPGAKRVGTIHGTVSWSARLLGKSEGEQILENLLSTILLSKNISGTFLMSHNELASNLCINDGCESNDDEEGDSISALSDNSNVRKNISESNSRPSYFLKSSSKARKSIRRDCQADKINPYVVVAFDFAGKTAPTVSLDAVIEVLEKGWGVWIDCCVIDEEEVVKTILGLGLVNADAILKSVKRTPRVDIEHSPEHIHFSLSHCAYEGADMHQDKVDLIIGENFILTLHGENPTFLNKVRAIYYEDFLRFAKSMVYSYSFSSVSSY